MIVCYLCPSNLSIHISICLLLYSSISVSVCSICLSLSACLPLSLSVCLSLCLPLSVCLFVCFSTDMGWKLGQNGLDNGFVAFDNYAIPRENLLNKVGVYVCVSVSVSACVCE